MFHQDSADSSDTSYLQSSFSSTPLRIDVTSTVHIFRQMSSQISPQMSAQKSPEMSAQMSTQMPAQMCGEMSDERVWQQSRFGYVQQAGNSAKNTPGDLSGYPAVQPFVHLSGQASNIPLQYGMFNKPENNDFNHSYFSNHASQSYNGFNFFPPYNSGNIIQCYPGNNNIKPEPGISTDQTYSESNLIQDLPGMFKTFLDDDTCQEIRRPVTFINQSIEYDNHGSPIPRINQQQMSDSRSSDSTQLSSLASFKPMLNKTSHNERDYSHGDDASFSKQQSRVSEVDQFSSCSKSMFRSTPPRLYSPLNGFIGCATKTKNISREESLQYDDPQLISLYSAGVTLDKFNNLATGDSRKIQRVCSTPSCSYGFNDRGEIESNSLGMQPNSPGMQHNSPGMQYSFKEMNNNSQFMICNTSVTTSTTLNDVKLKYPENPKIQYQSFQSRSHGRPASSQAEPESSQSGHSSSQGRRSSIQGGPTSSQGGPTSSQGGPTSSQGGSTSSQGGPTSFQGGSTSSQGGPMSAHSRPASSKSGPALSQGGPSSSHVRPKSPQNRPLSFQGGSASYQGRFASFQGGPASSQGGPASFQGGPVLFQGGPTSCQERPASSLGGSMLLQDNFASSVYHEHQASWMDPNCSTPPQITFIDLKPFADTMTSIDSRPKSESSDIQQSLITSNHTVGTRTDERYRRVYSVQQLEYMEDKFKVHQFLTPRKKAVYAMNTALSERQVKFWFQNRRAKEKKQLIKRAA